LETGVTNSDETPNVQKSLEALAKRFGNDVAVAVTGPSLDRNTFSKHLSGSNLIHFHGHTNDGRKDRGPINRGLQIEPLALGGDENRDYYRRLWYESGFARGDTGIFSTEDVFRTNLNSPLVTLMACSSGEQDISRSDDPIGLISAFLTAGASSVIGTWHFARVSKILLLITLLGRDAVARGERRRSCLQ
jgi:CHAT domain-containing protein